MQLLGAFSTLLASLLVATTLSGDVYAHPVRRNGGMVTMPLKRIEARRDVHPTILLQQHMNRGERRLARMKGRAAPSDLELREKIVKRMYIPATGPGSRTQQKRFNRKGTSVEVASTESTETNEGIDLHTEDTNEAIGKNKLKGHKGNGAGNNNKNNNNSGSGTATASAAAGTGTGISQIDIDDAQNGGLTAASDPTANNSLGLDIEANDVGYIGTVQIGTPSRDFKILMDSGSADFWVGAEDCQSTAGGGCGNHTFLGTQSSSSFVDTNKQFQVTYGSGAVAGDIITDDVTLAGLALNTHSFGVATQETDDFADDSVPFDGLMGLAQSTLSEQGVLTPVESLAKNGDIADAITSFKLGRVADGTNDGEVTFGGLDTTKFNQDTLTTFDNVNTQGFWEGSMDSITVDGTDLGLSGRTAILDTGTTLIIAPQDDADAVHAAIPGAQSDGQGGYIIPCTTTSSVALSFGGKSFAIDSRDLLFAAVDSNDPTGNCVSGISAGNVGGANEWLVGDVFLKNAYFSTDVSKNQISLAELV